MPITMKMEGLSALSDQLSRLGGEAGRIAGKGLYDGAGIMADELKKGADAIRTAPFRYTVSGTRLPSPEEKAIVQQADAGIARFERNGTEVNTSVGYRNAGYAMLAGRNRPVPKIVNAINSGTSFMQKQPFVRQAANSGAKKAEAAIIQTIEQKIEEILKK